MAVFDYRVAGELVEALVEEAHRCDLASTGGSEERGVDQSETMMNLRGDLLGDPGRRDGVAELGSHCLVASSTGLADFMEARRPAQQRFDDLHVEGDWNVGLNLVLLDLRCAAPRVDEPLGEGARLRWQGVVIPSVNPLRFQRVGGVALG